MLRITYIDPCDRDLSGGLRNETQDWFMLLNRNYYQFCDRVLSDKNLRL
ncbi:MAG: hypothetical protein F6K44_08880 [Moorea sp. SIO3E2]|nr:hypothetical protein [Moorena sp. SIO3E2]